jgi:hypothetical protein
MRALTAAAVLAITLAAGCFEGKGDLTLNPDGSGKVTGEIAFPLEVPWTAPKRVLTGPNAPPEVLKAPEELAREAVLLILQRSGGIDAWKDVSFEPTSGNRVRFKGTAYFRDLAKVRISPDTKSRLSFGSDGTNQLVLVLSRSKPDAPKSGIQISPDELAKRLKDERAKYQLARSAVTREFSGIALDLTFRLPGTVDEVKNLEERGGAMAVHVEGFRIFQTLDVQMMDNAFVGGVIFSGRSFSEQMVRDMANQKIFGLKGDSWARMKGPFADRFDYKAEVDAAKKAYPAMLVKLGLQKDKAPARPPAPAPQPPPKKAADPLPGKGGVPNLPMPGKLPNIPAPILPF